MHREDLVVRAGVEELTIGHDELRADQQCLDPTEQEEDESGRHVAETDDLVIDGAEPVDDRARPAEG